MNPYHKGSLCLSNTRAFNRAFKTQVRNRVSISALALSTVSVLGFVLTIGACKSESSGGKSGDPGTTSKPGDKGDKGDKPNKPKKISQRSKWRLHRNLLDELGRAELRSGGLIINMGTADQHKYTRGGWKSGWKIVGDTKPTAATSDWGKATLDVLLDEVPAEVVVRARSLVGGHSIRPYMDSTALKSADLTSEWQTVRVPMPEGIKAGEHTLSFRFSAKGKDHTEVDWVYLPTKAGAELPPIEPMSLPVNVGETPRRALVAPSDRSYSFYLEPAAGEHLIVDVGSKGATEFEVRAQVDGEAPQSLWSGSSKDDWTEVVVDLSKFAGRAVRLDLVNKGEKGIAGWGEPALFRPAPKTVAAKRKKAKNVIYILIDTARADAFNPESKINTPTYDALAAKSTRFLSAYNNENWTKPSVATTLSAVYPSTHQTKSDTASVPAKLQLLPELLKSKGFATSGYVANGYVSNKFGFEKGWDQFTNYIRESKNSAAENVYRDALGWLEQNKDSGKPYFLYIQTIDPHVNYSVDKEYWGQYFDGDYKGFLGPSVAADEQITLTKKTKPYTERDVDWLKALYAGEITYHDEHMGKFLAAIEEKGLAPDTVLFVSNDHGEETGDHGSYGHGHSLYDEVIRAPLLIHYPPTFAARTVEETVEHVDVAPTILDLLGLEPWPQAEGQSLVPLVTDEPIARPLYAITEFLDGRRSLRVGRYKLMRSSGDWIRVFDISKDPKEMSDLNGKAPIVRRLCETYLGEGIAVPAKSRRGEDLVASQRFEAGTADISPEMRKQFEALGYFGAKPDPVD